MGREFDVQVLTELSERPLDDVLDSLEEASASHVVTDVSTRGMHYRFEHALTRETLYQEFGAIRRSRIHQQVALILERVYAHDLESHVTELAHHFTEASRLNPTSRAVDYSRQAAGAALSILAYEDAVEHYERALASVDRVSEHEGRVRAEVLVCLGDALALAGQLVPARARFSEAATAARRYRAPEALAGAALGFASISSISTIDKDAVDLLESALESLPPGDHPLTARVLARLANSLYLSNDDARLDRLSSDAVAMARRLGDPLVLAEALQFRHGSIRGPGVTPARLAVADEMADLANRARSVEHEVQAHELRLCDLLVLGDIEGVNSVVATLDVLVESVSGRWGHWAPRILAMRALLEGDLARAEEFATEAFMIGQQHQDPDVFQLYGIQVGGIRREQDRAAEVEPAIRVLSEQSPEIAAWRCALIAMLAEQGDFTAASELLDGVALGHFEVLPTDDFRQVALVMLADGCVLIGDLERGAEVMELLRPYAAENVVVGPAVDCYGSAARPLGALATALGSFDEAETFLRQALEFNANLGSRRWTARTQVDLARLFLRRGDANDEANALLDAALTTATELGLTLVARLATDLHENR